MVILSLRINGQVLVDDVNHFPFFNHGAVPANAPSAKPSASDCFPYQFKSCMNAKFDKSAKTRNPLPLRFLEVRKIRLNRLLLSQRETAAAGEISG